MQPKTIETFKDAQRAVESGGFLPKYTAVSEELIEFPEKQALELNVQSEVVSPRLPAPRRNSESTSFLSVRHDRQLGDVPEPGSRSKPVFAANIFMMTPSQSENFPPILARKTVSRVFANAENSQVDVSSAAVDTTSFEATAKVDHDTEMKSLKSSSSVESFKSAKSIQDAELDVARKVKAVQSVLHAFRTALQILDNLVERRLPDKSGDLYSSAKGLEEALDDGKDTIDRMHIGHFKQHRQKYLSTFTDKSKL